MDATDLGGRQYDAIQLFAREERSHGGLVSQIKFGMSTRHYLCAALS
jgi:hypothetical protein